MYTDDHTDAILYAFGLNPNIMGRRSGKTMGLTKIWPMPDKFEVGKKHTLHSLSLNEVTEDIDHEVIN